MQSQLPVPQATSFAPEAVDPNCHHPTSAVPQPAGVNRPPRPNRKLTPAIKDHICELVARGHTVAATARMAGVSERSIYRERRRDPIFRNQLNEKREDIAEMCFQSLRNAAPQEFRAAIQLYKLIYPERINNKPDTVTRKQYEAWTSEVLALFNSIATDEQMEELNRLMKKA